MAALFKIIDLEEFKMKKMFFTAVLICAMTFSSVCAAYAGPTVTAGTRQVTADNIIIKESAPGAIKKDKNIYLMEKLTL